MFPEPTMALPVEPLPQAQQGDATEVIDLETTPDWKRKTAPMPQAGLMVPAPKKQGVSFVGSSGGDEPVSSEESGHIRHKRRAGIGYMSGHEDIQRSKWTEVAKSNIGGWGARSPPERSSKGGGCASVHASSWITQPTPKWNNSSRSSRMWQGPSLQFKAKARKDIRLAEGEGYLGFEWRFLGAGHPPQVVSVDPTSKIRAVTQVGDALLRVNGLDTTMFSEQQIGDILRQRPLALRFGGE